MKVSKLALYALFVCCIALGFGQAAAEHSTEAVEEAQEDPAVETTAAEQMRVEPDVEIDSIESSDVTSAPFVQLPFADDSGLVPAAGGFSPRNGFAYRKICPVTCQPCNTAADCSIGACKLLPYCP